MIRQVRSRAGRDSKTGTKAIDEAFARQVVPRREAGVHKWEVGGVLVIGGAPSYIGAPALCALGAMRSGAGIVTLAVSRSVVPAIATLAPEATFIPMPEGEALPTADRAAKLIAEQVDRYRAVVIGPGLSEDQFAARLMSRTFGIGQSGGPAGFGFRANENGDSGPAGPQGILGSDRRVVVDADALNWLSQQSEWWSNLPPRTLVLTPHAGEMARLLDTSSQEILEDPTSAVQQAAERWNQFVVLKYGPVAASDGESVLTIDDAPTSLATAGSGDVFAGMIGAFLAQGLEPLDAIGLAMYVGTRAARSLERRTGSLGLIASDLPAAFAGALAELEQNRDA